MNFSVKLLIVAVFSAVAILFSVVFYQKYSELSAQARMSVVVVNVLAKEQYDDCHIKDSIHVDLGDLDQFEQNTPKDTTVVVYCSNYLCSTSDYVAEKLKKAGFNKVFIYPGGMAEWFQQGLPIEGPAAGLYLRKKINPPAVSDSQVKAVDTQTLLTLMRGDREKI